MYSDKIKDFACRISGKLEDDLLEDALNYLDHNEEALAIEILCDHLIEYDVPLSQDDLSFLNSILSAMNINILMPSFKYFIFS